MRAERKFMAWSGGWDEATGTELDRKTTAVEWRNDTGGLDFVAWLADSPYNASPLVRQPACTTG